MIDMHYNSRKNKTHFLHYNITYNSTYNSTFFILRCNSTSNNLSIFKMTQKYQRLFLFDSPCLFACYMKFE